MKDYESLGMVNYNQYRSCTAKNDWRGIFKINHPTFSTGFLWTHKELKVLPDYLEPEEVVFAFCSGLMPQTITSNRSDSGMNTWLVVLTSTRFLFLDHAFWTRSVDTQSIRHEHVQAVSASQGWIMGKIILDLGARLVTIDNVGKGDVKVMAMLANCWYDTIARVKRDQQVPVQFVPGHKSISDELIKLADLHAAGILSDDEFSAAKRKIIES